MIDDRWNYDKVLAAARQYAAGFRDFSLSDATHAIAGQLGMPFPGGLAGWFRDLVQKAMDQISREGRLGVYPRGTELPEGGTSGFRQYRTIQDRRPGMIMDAQDWADLGTIFRAGAARARSWPLNASRQQEAEILDFQADQCDVIARERAGNPPVVHDHDHYHEQDGRRILHRHEHSHGRGKTGHDIVPPGHPHRLDPFADPEPLFPRTGDSA